MATPTSGVRASPGDSVREFTPEEKEVLTGNLAGIARDVHSGKCANRDLNPDLLCEYHYRLFAGVRDHAGKMRRDGWGAPHLIFGPNRSTPREDVRDRIESVLREACSRVGRLLANPEMDTYEIEAITLAVRVHAEIIRIHPFEDGNGRTSRMVMSHLLVRLGLQPIPVEAVRKEYEDALNHYYCQNNITPLVDLFIRVAGGSDLRNGLT